MNTSNLINCKYHANVLNAAWCPRCGNPVCEKCISTFSKWIPTGYAFTCPPCKKITLRPFIYGYFIVFVVLTTIFLLLATFGQDLVFQIASIGLFFYGLVQFSSWANSINKERIKYNAWKMNLDEELIPDEKIQSLIQNKQLDPCKYHGRAPGINHCEICGSKVCAKCSAILYEFASSILACWECFWTRKRRSYKLFGATYAIIYFLYSTLFIALLITFWGPPSFIAVGSSTFMIFTIAFILLLYYFFQNRTKYHDWKKRILGE